MSIHERTATFSGARGHRESLGEIDGVPHLVISFERSRPHMPTRLTPAEASIAYLLLAGATNADLAYARNRSIPTVVKQVSSLFRKLGVQGRGELAARLLDGASPEPELASSSGRRGVDSVRPTSY